MWKDTNVSDYLPGEEETNKEDEKRGRSFTVVPECRFRTRVYSRKEY